MRRLRRHFFVPQKGVQIVRCYLSGKEPAFPTSSTSSVSIQAKSTLGSSRYKNRESMRQNRMSFRIQILPTGQNFISR